jgi:hypothetical protein
MSLVVEEDESLDPGNVRFFGAERVVLETHNVADLIEQFSGRALHSLDLR